MTTKLSVNLNKVATIRNARGGTRPSVVRAAGVCIDAGCHGITVHPRPDERHIRRSDVYDLHRMLPEHIEFNIEGYPTSDFVTMVLDVAPTQVTLVPDPPDVLTSNAGWDLTRDHKVLDHALARFADAGIRTSIFLEADVDMVTRASTIGTDRIELYTGPYAEDFGTAQQAETSALYAAAGQRALDVGLGLNAGHDLDQDNLPWFVRHVPGLLEVSIGHALISDALYDGLAVTVRNYLTALAP